MMDVRPKNDGIKKVQNTVLFLVLQYIYSLYIKLLETRHMIFCIDFNGILIEFCWRGHH